MQVRIFVRQRDWRGQQRRCERDKRHASSRHSCNDLPRPASLHARAGRSAQQANNGSVAKELLLSRRYFSGLHRPAVERCNLRGLEAGKIARACNFLEYVVLDFNVTARPVAIRNSQYANSTIHSERNLLQE